MIDRIPVKIGVDRTQNNMTNELEFRYTVSRNMAEQSGFINAMGVEVTHRLTEKILETQLSELTEAVIKTIDKDAIRKKVEDEIARAAVEVWRAATR